MLRIESLTSELASQRASEIAAIKSGIPDDHWEKANFLCDLPGKWDLSTLVLDESQHIAGYLIASRPDPCRAHLHRIVVAPEYRGSGLGTRLLNDLKSRANKLGLRRLSLKVGQDNEAAKRLYTRIGLIQDGDSPPYQWMGERLASNLIVACHQPNFLPWMGYFAKLVQCDYFVILDDVQMPTGRSYVSRTRVADAQGSRWLSVPVTRQSGQRIAEVELAPDPRWRTKHLSSIRQMYAKAPHVDAVLELMRAPYEADHVNLAEFNIHLLERVMAHLGVRRKVIRSSTLGIDSTSDQRLIDIVKHVGGDTYLSGKGGQNYQDPEKFAAENIDLAVYEYEPISYSRGAQKFEPGLSIIDVVAWQGSDVFEFLRYPGDRPVAQPLRA